MTLKGTVKQGTTLKEATVNTTQPQSEDPTPRMPHERDESAHDTQSSGERKVMKQAHDDIQSGMVDTDCRTQSGTGNGKDGNSLCAVPEKKSGDR